MHLSVPVKKRQDYQAAEAVDSLSLRAAVKMKYLYLSCVTVRCELSLSVNFVVFISFQCTIGLAKTPGSKDLGSEHPP